MMQTVGRSVSSQCQLFLCVCDSSFPREKWLKKEEVVVVKKEIRILGGAGDLLPFVCGLSFCSPSVVVVSGGGALGDNYVL